MRRFVRLDLEREKSMRCVTPRGPAIEVKSLSLLDLRSCVCAEIRSYSFDLKNVEKAILTFRRLAVSGSIIARTSFTS